MEYQRLCGRIAPPSERIGNFREFHGALSEEEQRLQGARCMDCGVPFCQYGRKIAGMYSGCPLNNLVSEINDLVHRGKWELAYARLSKTNCFPEFTSRVCPGLCEAACTCGLHGEPVASKENEHSVIEYAFSHGLVRACPPRIRTGKRIAVVGSGPAGLAAAYTLNRRGHSVTVYERSDRPGGLLRYGIPNMKLEKEIIDRRVQLLEQEGVEFICGVDVGRTYPGRELLKAFDRVILACGASRPRDISVPGRDAAGILFAVDFLTDVTKSLFGGGRKLTGGLKGRRVLVIGGGDTGNDCVGTAIRLGAADVIQLEMMPEPPKQRAAGNPWPEWPMVKKTDYGQEEAIDQFGRDPRLYATTATGFTKDEKGRVCAAGLVSLSRQMDVETGRYVMKAEPGSERETPADLVLIAAGFLGCEPYVTESFGIKTDTRGNVWTYGDSCRTADARIFTAGDMHSGQSLVVRAIAEGKRAAMEVERSLTGEA